MRLKCTITVTILLLLAGATVLGAHQSGMAETVTAAAYADACFHNAAPQTWRAQALSHSFEARAGISSQAGGYAPADADSDQREAFRGIACKGNVVYAGSGFAYRQTPLGSTGFRKAQQKARNFLGETGNSFRDVVNSFPQAFRIAAVLSHSLPDRRAVPGKRAGDPRAGPCRIAGDLPAMA